MNWPILFVFVIYLLSNFNMNMLLMKLNHLEIVDFFIPVYVKSCILFVFECNLSMLLFLWAFL